MTVSAAIIRSPSFGQYSNQEPQKFMLTLLLHLAKDKVVCKGSKIQVNAKVKRRAKSLKRE